MPKIAYVSKRFQSAALNTIEQAEAICNNYAAQGLTLTLRQLYYQFVARGLIPNRDSEYKRLGSIINDARLAGLIDWNHLEDRTRSLRSLGHWDSPASMIESAARSYHIDMWDEQEVRVEVWIEKDALVGVIERVCRDNDVPFFSCRGYTSQSEIWGAAMRLLRYIRAGQQPVILHFGDHDPSGIDMTRDITERLDLFIGKHVLGNAEVDRLALNYDQVVAYNPPPNPAKVTDSRFYNYQRIHGDESWELDALEPTVIGALIQERIDSLRDPDLWAQAENRKEHERSLLEATRDNWDSVVGHLEELGAA